MNVKGNYTLSSFFTKAEGPFTVVLKNVFVKGNASLAVERDGRLRTKDIKMDITFKDMAMDFQNLGMDPQIQNQIHPLTRNRFLFAVYIQQVCGAVFFRDSSIQLRLLFSMLSNRYCLARRMFKFVKKLMQILKNCRAIIDFQILYLH